MSHYVALPTSQSSAALNRTRDGSPRRKRVGKQGLVSAVVALVLGAGGLYALFTWDQAGLGRTPFSASSTTTVVPTTSTVPKIKILHLIDQDTADVLMDRWLLHSHKGFANRPDLVDDAVLWGPGFPGWSSKLNLTENVEATYGKADYFDAVLAYFNTDQVEKLGIDPKPWFYQIQDLSSRGRGTIIMDRPHEMRDLRRASMYDLANVTLVLAPYAQEVLEYKHYAKKIMFVHQPHFVDPDFFFHPVTKTKTQDVIIAGDHGSFYPFRHRLVGMILDKKIPGWVRGHPGYPDIEKSRPASINANSQEQQLINFGNDLSDAKLCLITSSRWGYSVQKYTEAAASGCLILGNVPLDREWDWHEAIVPMSNADSDQHIKDTINHWLIHEEDRLSRAKKAQDWVIDNFSVTKYVEDVIRMIGLVRAGQRGMVLPFEWQEAPKVLPEDG